MRMRIGSSARSALALLSAAMPARMASAAQQARIARFFCFSGAPQKAMTLSPMNLSTVLPSASIPPEALTQALKGRTPMQTLEEGKAVWMEKFVA